jgi:hypothetical protein
MRNRAKSGGLSESTNVAVSEGVNPASARERESAVTMSRTPRFIFSSYRATLPCGVELMLGFFPFWSVSLEPLVSTAARAPC